MIPCGLLFFFIVEVLGCSEGRFREDYKLGLMAKRNIVMVRGFVEDCKVDRVWVLVVGW